jgi:hypothetical protein
MIITHAKGARADNKKEHCSVSLEKNYLCALRVFHSTRSRYLHAGNQSSGHLKSKTLADERGDELKKQCQPACKK